MKTERRSADLDVVCHLLEEHLEERWEHIILPNRSPGDKSQLCAAMWNTKRMAFQNATPLPVEHKVGDDNLWDRKPHLISFASDHAIWRKDEAGEWHKVAETRRFNFVPLHMKSNYGGVTLNRRVRAKEAITLCETLAGTPHDPSLMLIGDTNILSNTEPAIETFVQRGFVDLSTTTVPRTGARSIRTRRRSTAPSWRRTVRSSATPGSISCGPPT